MDLEEQYDKIYRYCYFKLRHQQKAEDITQETFLRFLENTAYREQGKRLQYLYTIARNLCMDEFRKMTYEQSMGTFSGEETKSEDDRKGTFALHNAAAYMERNVNPESGADMQERIVNVLMVREALGKLTQQERELLLLYHVNEVPTAVIAKLMGVSRFAIYRMLKRAERNFRMKLQATT